MMFGKGAWTLLKLVQGDGGVAPLEAFKTAFEAAGSRYIPLVAISEAIHEKSSTIGLAPFSQPRMGDLEEIEFYVDKAAKDFKSEDTECFINNQTNLREWEMVDGELLSGQIHVPLDPFWEPSFDQWQFSPGVYGMWVMMFEYIDAMDVNSKKEHLAYNYGAPFKFQSADIKKQITEQVEDINTFVRKHHQVVIDFNMGYIWISSGAKAILEPVMTLLDEMGLIFETPTDLVGDINADDVSEALETLYNASVIKDDVVRRLEEFKLHGADGVEPDSNAVMEKILKAYCAFSEIQGFHVGMSAPLALFLDPRFVSPTAARSTYEVTELLNSHESARVAVADLTFCHYTDRIAKNGEPRKFLEKLFSIQASPVLFHKDLPGLRVCGLNIDNYRRMIKVHIKATGNAPTIAEYWKMSHDSMKESVFTYYSVLKDIKESR